MTAGDPAWGADSECGHLRDVLVCRPEHFRWLPTSAISKATLAAGHSFDPGLARSQHDALVAAYGSAGVRVHFAEPDSSLPYQVFTRDSSAMTPGGAVVTQLAQPWRRGEYAPTLGFLEEAGIPIRALITAGSLEGGDVMLVEPGRMLIGNGEERTQIEAARQLAGWLESDGWEVRIEPIPSQFVHIDVLVAIIAPKLAAVCVEAASGGLVRWLEGLDFEIIEVPLADALGLGVNAVSLGADRVISSAESRTLNAAIAARGIEVTELDLSMFTRGGGGPHCLSQALRRDPLGTG